MTPKIKVTGRVLTYSADTIARNRELLGGGNPGATSPVQQVQVLTRPTSRIRQSSKPKLNQLEREALEWLRAGNTWGYSLRPHALRLELANGCTYEPDIIGEFTGDGKRQKCYLRAWEVKGKQMWDDAVVKLKVAATHWPSIQFTLIWKQDGQWMTQEVLP